MLRATRCGHRAEAGGRPEGRDMRNRVPLLAVLILAYGRLATDCCAPFLRREEGDEVAEKVGDEVGDKVGDKVAWVE